MINFEVDYGELTKLIENLRAAEEGADKVIWAQLKQVATQMDEEIDEAMPVDTGRAAAGWGKYRPELLGQSTKISDKPLTHRTRPSKFTQKAQISSESDAIWEENEKELEIIEGTRVPYVPLLNENHPQFMGQIDMAVERAQVRLEGMGRTLLEWFERKLSGR